MFDSVYAFARGLHQFSKNPNKVYQFQNQNHHHHTRTSVDDHEIFLRASSTSSIDQSINQNFVNPPYSYDAKLLVSQDVNNNPSQMISSIFSMFGDGGSGSNNNPQSSPSSSSYSSSNPLNTFASCLNESPWTSGLSLYNYIDSVCS